jgi:predicted ATPase/Tfp pilus assembly protein PilF
MTQALPPSKVERAAALARAFTHRRGGTAPHDIIEDLIGLEAYRRAMGCPDTEALAAYAEDRLTLEEALNIAVHEERCPVCQTDIADMRGVVQQGVCRFYANLPSWATPFIGREGLREILNTRLQEGQSPLLTLTGAPGMGKTRLMLEAVLEHSYLFPDGVWYMPLSTTDSPSRVASDMAHTVGLRLEENTDPLALLQEFLTARRALLVLDDVAPHSATAHVLNTLTGPNSELCCLTTGGRTLELSGERAVPLPPLQIAAEIRDVHVLQQLESVQLFRAHVDAAQPAYAFDEQDILAAAAICGRANGNPLAIEIAAARVRDMSILEVRERLEQYAPQRSERRPETALNDLTAWTYDLLPAHEKRILTQLSVFPDGFFAEQAAAICEDDETPRTITALHQRALLQCTMIAGRPRYQLLPPIHRFAGQRLGDEAEKVQRSHAQFFLNFAQERATTLSTASQVEAMEQLDLELPNLRTGMDWAHQADAWPMVGRYGLALRGFLDLHGDWQECADRLQQSVAAFAQSGDETAQQQARIALANCSVRRGDYQEARTLLMAVIDQASRLGNTALLAESQYALGNLEQQSAHYAEATALIEQASRNYEARGDRWGQADCRLQLALIAGRQGNYAQAEALIQESLRTQRERGDRYRIGNALAYLGNIYQDQGRLEEARNSFAECLQMRQAMGDVRGIATATLLLGSIWLEVGEYARARYCYAEAARRLEQLGDRRNLGKVWAHQGNMALMQGDAEGAREAFTRALEAFKATNDRHSIAAAEDDLGRVAQHEQQWEQALGYYRSCLPQFEALGAQIAMASTLSRLGQVLWEKQERETALIAQLVALRVSQECGVQEQKEIEAALESMENATDMETMRVVRQQAKDLTLAETIAYVLRA